MRCINFLAVTILTLFPRPITGEEAVVPSARSTAFPKDFVAYEVVKNDPALHTQERLVGRDSTYFIGFRHTLSDEWLMGVGLNFKSFTVNPSGDELSFLTLTHEAYHMVRLFHPTYLTVGPKILYLLPTQNSGFPIRRQPEFQTEIGAAFSLGVMHQINRRLIAGVRVDRWRGIKTNRFHGVEVGAGLTYAISR